MIRIGVIGLGMGGSYGAIANANPDGVFAAMCTKSPERLEARRNSYRSELGIEPAGYLDPLKMLENEKLDGVVISTPSSTHHELVELCASRGVHVLVDKPVDISDENIASIRKSVAKSGILCGVNYNKRCEAQYSGLKAALDKKMLGKALFCDVRMKFLRPQEYYAGWRGTWKYDGGGTLMNQGAHPCDLLCWMLGEPESVLADCAALNHSIESEDWASIAVRFKSGARATLVVSTCAAPRRDYLDFDLHAENGSVSLHNEEVIFSSLEKISELAPMPFKHPVDDFIDAIKNRRPPMVSVEDAEISVRLINAAYESAREGRRVLL